MRRSLLRFAVFSTLAVATTAVVPRALASVLLAMELPALTTRAEHVVVGEVRAISAAWSADHRSIYSRIDVDVVETWRSNALRSLARVSILQPGGQIDDLEQVVSGLPTFAVGERVVLFLRGPSDRATVVGGALGKLPVHEDTATRAPMVWAPRLDGATVVAPGGGAVVAVPARPTPLGLFRAQVEAATSRRAP